MPVSRRYRGDASFSWHLIDMADLWSRGRIQVAPVSAYQCAAYAGRPRAASRRKPQNLPGS